MRATWSDEVARLYPNLNLGQVARLRLNILCILSGETKKTTFLLCTVHRSSHMQSQRKVVRKQII